MPLREATAKAASQEASWLMTYFAWLARRGRPSNPRAFLAWLASAPRSTYALRREMLAYRRFRRFNGLSNPLDHPAHAATFQQLLARATPRSVGRPDLAVIYRLIDERGSDATRLRNAAALLLRLLVGAHDEDISRLDPSALRFDETGLSVHLPAQTWRPMRAIRRHASPRYCPVAAIERWFTLAPPEGPLFPTMLFGKIAGNRLTVKGSRRVVTHTFEAVGYRGTLLELRHSLMAIAFERGASVEEIAQQFGYKHEPQVRLILAELVPGIVDLSPYLQ